MEGVPALRELDPDFLGELGETLTRREAAEGEYLFRKGPRPPANAFYLVSAVAEIVLGPPGEERSVGLARPGELVGWASVLSADLFPVSARVVETGEVLQIPAEALRNLVGRHSSAGLVLASAADRYLQGLLRWLPPGHIESPRSRWETYPFRKSAQDAMSSPAVTLPPEASAREAAMAMDRAEIGSVLVSDGELRGIVTEQDLVRRVFAKGKDSDSVAVRDIMSTPVASLGPSDLLHKALGIMRRQNVRHVAVMDEGQAVGILSVRSLLLMAESETLELADQIESADSVDALADARKRSHLLCANLLAEGAPSEEIGRLLSHTNRDIHRRVLEVAISSLETEGWGSPPVSFCFILMGSHGRSENHFNTDQDHGMVLADYPPEDWDRVEPYFMRLSGRVSEDLTRVGFEACRGYVMSSNPVWRKPLREWKDQIRGWFANPTSNAVRYSTLFYDFRPVWGDASTARDLREFITQGIQHNFQLLQRLFQEASRHKVPLTFFRNFVTEKSGPHKGQMDLKRSGFLFVVECARILALRHGVAQTGTIERLEALSQKGVIPPDEAEFIQTSYRALFHFLLNAQAKKLRCGDQVDNYIDPRVLSIQERYILRHALEAASRLQSITHSSFGNVFF